MYGSRLLKTNPDRHSALDFVVIVDDYRSFYEGLAQVGELGRPVWLMRALSRVLAPNVIAYVPDDGAHGIAKCLIISTEDFERALGSEPPDHFSARTHGSASRSDLGRGGCAGVLGASCDRRSPQPGAGMDGSLPR